MNETVEKNGGSYRVRSEVCEQQYGFMPRKTKADANFTYRTLMEKYRKENCIVFFVDLEKVHDRVTREQPWYCMKWKRRMSEMQDL